MTDEEYLKKLEIILKAAQDEYKQITYDRRQIQHGLLKNYIWLSTILFSAQTAILLYALDTRTTLVVLEPGKAFLFFIILAILLSVGTFALGVDTIRGRKEVKFPYITTFWQMRDYAYRERYDLGRPDNGGEIFPHDLYNLMIGDLQYGIDNNRQTAGDVGKKLRCLSWLLLGSIASTVLALIVAFW